jgi:hypothetical protein
MNRRERGGIGDGEILFRPADDVAAPGRYPLASDAIHHVAERAAVCDNWTICSIDHLLRLNPCGNCLSRPLTLRNFCLMLLLQPGYDTAIFC